MKFYGQSKRRPRQKEQRSRPNMHKRKPRLRKRKLMPLLFPAIFFAIVFFLFYLNMRLTPIYVQFAETQTTKIASHVISSAINARIANVLDVNDIIENVPPSESGGMVKTKFNAEIVNRVLADTQKLVQLHLEQAESGNMDLLLPLDEIEYDPEAMEERGGIVFLIPLGQATGIPLLGNLGPKIPIRFHVIGEVQVNTETTIEEFGINNAYIELNILLEVNVQIIVPLATKTSVVKQKVPLAYGLFEGEVPPIYNVGDGGGVTPKVEVPLKLPESND